MSFTLGRNDSSVQFYKVAHNGKAQAQSSMSSRRAAFCLSEPIEDMRQKARVDALPGIAYDDFNIGFRAHDPNQDHSFRRRELDRIVQKVPKNLLKAGGIEIMDTPKGTTYRVLD